MALSEGLQHIFYEHQIPPDIERQLEKIYQSPFCVTKYFELFRGIRSLNALVIFCGSSDPRHIIAYTISGREITVLNELVAIEQEFIKYFADAVFSRYPAVTTVNFNCLKSKIVDFNYPWRLWKTSHDIFINLPYDMDSYNSRLSGHTRKNLKNYLSRLQRQYADFSFHVAATHEADPAVIGRIIEMNILRMKDKNIRSGYNKLFEKRIIEFCRLYGLVSTLHIGGNIVAGTICYEVGNQAYMEIISHHPDFNNDRVGQVCLYLTVKHMIEKGRESFHMLWGENEYKYRFLGEKQDLYFISIYRTYVSKLLCIQNLAKHTGCYLARQLEYIMRKYIFRWFRQKK